MQWRNVNWRANANANANNDGPQIWELGDDEVISEDEEGDEMEIEVDKMKQNVGQQKESQKEDDVKRSTNVNNINQSNVANKNEPSSQNQKAKGEPGSNSSTNPASKSVKSYASNVFNNMKTKAKTSFEQKFGKKV